MADAIRLYSEFADDLGNVYRVNIHDANFTGTTQPFTLGADGFVLRYAGNNEDRHQPVIGSEVTFTLVEENAVHTSFMDDLATATEQRFSVSIFEDPDGANTFFWGGVLYPEQVVRPFEYFPVYNTLTAADDLGNLPNILYNNSGAAYTGQASVVDHVLNCLNKLRSVQLWDTTDPFLYYVNDFDAVDYIGTNQLNDTRISHYGLYNPDDNNQNQYYSTFDVLENLAKVFNARIFQAQGKFWFLPVGAQKYSTTLTIERRQKDGTALAQISQAANKAFDASFVRLNGYEYTYLTPLKEVTRTRRYNGNWPIVFDSLYTAAQFNSAISDTDIDYNTGTVFSVSGTFTYEYNGDGTSTDNDRIGRVLLRMTIKAGGKYLRRDVTFVGQQEIFYGFGDPSEFPYVYTTHQYGATSWSSTTAYYNIVSPVFDENAGGSFTIPIFIETPALATDETGLDITVSIFGRDDLGANETALVNTANADYSIITLRADVLSGEALGDTVEFTATNSDNARGVIDQGEVIFGDAETVNADGIIRVIVGANAVPVTQWQSLNFTGTGIGINRLGVQEILGGQRRATRVQRGSVFGSMIHLWQVIDDTDGDYALFELTFTATDVTTELEAFLLERDLGSITTSIGDNIDTTTPIIERPIFVNAGSYEAQNRNFGIGFEGYGARNQTFVRSISNRAGVTSTVNDTDLHILNSWTGANGMARIILPPIAESHGRIISFHSDNTITANTYVELQPDGGDVGTTIDGAASLDFNRNYDGITILGHRDGNWYVIQRKSK